jgi:hypothetical protein
LACENIDKKLQLLKEVMHENNQAYSIPKLLSLKKGRLKIMKMFSIFYPKNVS